MWNRSYTASWGDVYTHFLFWASFFLEYFFENPAQKRINLAFFSTFLSKLIPFEQFIPFLSTFLSTFLSNIQQKYFFEHFFEYSKKYSKCWVLFWVLFWELFWGFFWDFHYDKTYLHIVHCAWNGNEGKKYGSGSSWICSVVVYDRRESLSLAKTTDLQQTEEVRASW